MSIHRNYVKIAAMALAISAALPALADDTAVMVGKDRHHYVFYRDHDIYFSPETETYFWRDNGSWLSGPILPPEFRRYISKGGIDIELDTMRPFERNDYVVSRYKADEPTTQQTTTTERSTSDNGTTTTTTTTTTTKHQYVYYGDHDIFFAPDTKTYYWQASGRWQSGAVLPPDVEPFVRNGGVTIELDTDRPYERHDYVIAHYKQKHDRDDQ
jgi:hypothetical protein